MSKVNRSYERRQSKSYAMMRESKDEVYQWLQWHEPAKSWIQPEFALRPTSVHHIHGRGAPERLHWFCNLIVSSLGCHGWVHDKFPPAGEIVCLRSKMAAEVRRRIAKESLPDDLSMRIWLPDVMAVNIGRDSLEGRIGELLNKDCCQYPLIQRYGQEILDFLAS